MSFVIAIDGVSGAGKGTLARLLAEHYGCDYLPTGNIYRLVAKNSIALGLDLEDEPALVNSVSQISEDQIYSDDLRSDKIANIASVISKMPNLRKKLDEFQRLWIKKRDFCVVEGRDIGIKICPDAAVKLYLEADLKVRANRRYKEIISLGVECDSESVYHDLIARDNRDMTREHSPLSKPEGAEIIDTTFLTVSEMIDRAVNIVEKKLTMG